MKCVANPITIRELGPEDVHVLERVREGTFDNPVEPTLAFAFLATGVNELVVALTLGEVIGFASGTALMHPDKPTGFLINEVGVHEDFQRQGVGRRLLERIIEVARSRGCHGIWLGTELHNVPARELYRTSGGEEMKGVFYGWDDAF